MIINILVKNVEISHVSKGKGYDVAEVTYSDKGQTKHQKVFSFKDPQLFMSVKDMEADASYDIEIKKEGNFWNWVGVKKAQAATHTSTAAPRSNYETPDERAYRQVLIVRQSCLAQAVAYINGQGTQDTEDPTENVLAIANSFVNWVMNAEEESPTQD